MRMRIGEFAAFCDVSVRALRIYDRMGLLKPAFTDESTGYRYYVPEQMQTLSAIAGYQKLGFSLKEIRTLLLSGSDAAACVTLLQRKQKENDRKADTCRYNNEVIQSILDSWQASPNPESEEDVALRLSRIACLENEKLEHFFSPILWL